MAGLDWTRYPLKHGCEGTRFKELGEADTYEASGMDDLMLMKYHEWNEGYDQEGHDD